jgi:formyl-CoA transferase
VIDLSHVYNGPYATYLLALAGARVIKVEPPEGEHLRMRCAVGRSALPFAMLNGNKECVTLNLKTDVGRAALLDLVKRADVLVENFAPGVMDRLGLGSDALLAMNPRLVYASSSGYGSDGPYRDYPAMDITVQAMTGVMSVTGFADAPPVKAGPAVCDFSAGTHLYGGIMTALFARERTGRGRVVEVAMQDAIYPALSSHLAALGEQQLEVPQRTGNRHGALAEAPYNVYRASDGYIAIIGLNTRHFHALLDAMARPDLKSDARFSSHRSRVENMDLIDETITAWTRHIPRDDLVQILIEHRVPHAPVLDLSEVVDDPNMHARGSLQRVDHPQLGAIVVSHSPIRFGGEPRLPLRPSAELGEHNHRVFVEWLCMTEDEVAALQRGSAG